MPTRPSNPPRDEANDQLVPGIDTRAVRMAFTGIRVFIGARYASADGMPLWPARIHLRATLADGRTPPPTSKITTFWIPTDKVSAKKTQKILGNDLY